MKSLAQAYLDLSLQIPVEDTTVKRRLERAYDILADKGYEVRCIDSNSYIVHKASTSLLEDNSHSYDVSMDSCTCPDFPTARGGLCKHRLAVMMYVEMGQQ